MATSSPPTAPPPAYERVATVVARTGLSRTFVYDAIAGGRIPSVKAGRSVLIPAGAVEEYLEHETNTQRPSVTGRAA